MGWEGVGRYRLKPFPIMRKSLLIHRGSYCNITRKKRRNKCSVSSSVLDPNTLNLDPDPDFNWRL